MPCPRCGGETGSHSGGVYEDPARGKVIVRTTRCTICGFAVHNIIWAEDGHPICVGWMSGQEPPPEVKEMDCIPGELLE